MKEQCRTDSEICIKGRNKQKKRRGRRGEETLKLASEMVELGKLNEGKIKIMGQN